MLLEGSRWKSSDEESSKRLLSLVFSALSLSVLHAPGARLRRLVCCFLSFANYCSGAIPCHDHGMFVALCAEKRRYVPERVVAFSQATVLARNTPKPNSTVGLGMHYARVKWDVASMLPRIVLPSSLYSNLIWARVQTDCSLPKLDHQSCSAFPPEVSV